MCLSPTPPSTEKAACYNRALMLIPGVESVLLTIKPWVASTGSSFRSCVCSHCYVSVCFFGICGLYLEGTNSP